MNIEFMPIDFTNEKDCAILAKWFNDPKINYLTTPNFYPGPLPKMTTDYISQINVHTKHEKYAYFIIADHYIVGDVNIVCNPEFLFKHDGNSCWLGITVGEEAYRGLGVGKEAMYFIENLARELGYTRMELGVFEFNDRAINFYKKLNYKQIGVVPNFTFYIDGWYDDLRFEKYL